MLMKKKLGVAIIILIILSQSVGIYAQGKTVMIEGVPIINQHPNMPTGCEVTALAMLLRYYGVDVDRKSVV